MHWFEIKLFFSQELLTALISKKYTISWCWKSQILDFISQNHLILREAFFSSNFLKEIYWRDIKKVRKPETFKVALELENLEKSRKI